MIVERSGKDKFCSVHAFTTFFYPKLKETGHSSVKRWTKKVDIFSYSLLLVPVHLGMHWCLAVIDMKNKTITYYDSMGGNNMGCLLALTEYLNEEHRTRKGVSLVIWFTMAEGTQRNCGWGWRWQALMYTLLFL